MQHTQKPPSALNVVKVIPGWGFVEQVVPVVTKLAERGDDTEIWVPEPWITHLIGSRDPTGRELERIGSLFVSPNGFRGLTRSKNFRNFVWRTRVTSLVLKVAGLVGKRELCNPRPAKYLHTTAQPVRVFSDSYFYDSRANLTDGQQRLRDSDLDSQHVSFYHGNFDPLSYPIPNNLPKQIDIYCYYREQWKRLQAVEDGRGRRVIQAVLPRIAAQLERVSDETPITPSIWFFSRSNGPPSGVPQHSKVETLRWLSTIALECNLSICVQLHPTEKRGEFLRDAKLAKLNDFSFVKFQFHHLVETSANRQKPLLAVSNFVGLVPNLVSAGIPCVELWPEDAEDYDVSEGRHRFDFSERGMSIAVRDLSHFRRLILSVLNGDAQLIESQRLAVARLYQTSGMNLDDLVALISTRWGKDGNSPPGSGTPKFEG